MSKLAHSNETTMNDIERDRLKETDDFGVGEQRAYLRAQSMAVIALSSGVRKRGENPAEDPLSVHLLSEAIYEGTRPRLNEKQQKENLK